MHNYARPKIIACYEKLINYFKTEGQNNDRATLQHILLKLMHVKIHFYANKLINLLKVNFI